MGFSLSGIGHVLGNVGTAIKKGVVDTGHAVGSVASNPWVQGLTAAGLAATGVGAPAAAAIMAAQKGGGALLKPGGNIGQGLTGAATGAMAGYGAAKAGSLLKGGGSILDKAKGVIGAKNAVGSVMGGGSPASGGGGGVGDFLGGIGGYLTGNGGGNALAIAQGANAAMLGKKSSDLADDALTSAKDNYAERAPLRTAGIAGMLNPGQGIASKLSSIPNRNAYSQPQIAPAGMNAMPASPTIAPARRAV